jgi:hypothetical protein
MIRIGKYWLNPDKIVFCEYDRHDLLMHLEPTADSLPPHSASLASRPNSWNTPWRPWRMPPVTTPSS